ncbi:hypothetical protein BDZ91DRAFT_504813 [Kalaharituber pfeilii]|nr:hypothetical protein BDZ91DRAFT_504813 [Kalaharituber pfeilii]
MYVCVYIFGCYLFGFMIFVYFFPIYFFNSLFSCSYFFFLLIYSFILFIYSVAACGLGAFDWMIYTSIYSICVLVNWLNSDNYIFFPLYPSTATEKEKEKGVVQSIIHDGCCLYSKLCKFDIASAYVRTYVGGFAFLGTYCYPEKVAVEEHITL